jgi:hypothetical protein
MTDEETLRLLAARTDAVRESLQAFLARSAERRAWVMDLAVAAPAVLARLGEAADARAADSRAAAPGQRGGLLATAASAARTLHAEVERTLARLPESTRGRHQRLSAATAQAGEQAKALGERVRAVVAVLREGVEGFGAALGALGDEASASAEEGARGLAEVVQATAVRRAADLAAVAGEPTAEELVARLASLRTRVDVAGREAESALAELVARCGEASDQSREARLELERLLDQLKGKLTPLERAMERVKDTAQTLGVY